ncbi:hypothetical protein F2Q70_00003354 [Brassica cretica]|uniref:Uncharacterized protein n=1 Tax=Brassica cretica TaxID=69181 RepID=A0A8S9IWM3_BRACR|nr:hypothetical protein F2Q70_00003354 [Brassica cretica]
MKWVRYGLRETASKGRRECMDSCRIDVSEELGRYVATERNARSFATWRPSGTDARSLRSDRAWLVATELGSSSVATNAKHRTRAREGSLRSDQTRHNNQTPILVGCYVASELEPELGRYVGTELEPKFGRYALPKRRYNISPCILVYPLMLSPEYRSEPISRSPLFLSYQSNFTVETAESSFFIERSRNKRFESKDSPKGPRTRLEAQLTIS